MFVDACATLGIHPFLSLHCKLNFSCIIVTEIISCPSVERVVERKRIHVLQEQIRNSMLFRSNLYFSLEKSLHLYPKKEKVNGNIEIIAKGSSSRVDSASYTFPLGFIFLFYIRSLI